MSKSIALAFVGAFALFNAGVAFSASRADLVPNAEPAIVLGTPALQTTDGKFAYVVGTNATVIPVKPQRAERVDLTNGLRTPIFSVAADASARIDNLEAGGGKLAVLVSRDRQPVLFPPVADYELFIVDGDGSNARSIRSWSALANVARCPSIVLESVTDQGEALVSVKKSAEACADTLSYELRGFRAQGGDRLLIRAHTAYSRRNRGDVFWGSSRAIGRYMLTTRFYRYWTDAEILRFGKSKLLKRIPMLERPKGVEREVDLNPRGQVLISTRVSRRTKMGHVPKLATVRMKPSIRSQRSVLIAKGLKTQTARFCGDVIMVATDTPVTDGMRWSIRGFVVRNGRAVRSGFSYSVHHASFDRMQLLSCRNGTLVFTRSVDEAQLVEETHYALFTDRHR